MIRSYCNINQSWVTLARLNESDFLGAAVLPTGDLVLACEYGVYRVKVSGE